MAPSCSHGCKPDTQKALLILVFLRLLYLPLTSLSLFTLALPFQPLLDNLQCKSGHVASPFALRLKNRLYNALLTQSLHSLAFSQASLDLARLASTLTFHFL